MWFLVEIFDYFEYLIDYYVYRDIYLALFAFFYRGDHD